MAAKAATKPQLAAQLFTLRDHCKSPKDAAATLKKVAKIGYRLAQISGPINAISGPELAQMAADAGVSLIGSHIGLKDWTEKYDEKLAQLKAIGCRYTAIPALPHEERASLAVWKKTAAKISQLQKKLAKDDIVLQYHNHKFEFERFGGKTGLEILYAAVPALQAEIDTFWVARGLQSPTQWILNMKGRMDQVHLKDGTIATVVNDKGEKRDMEQITEVGNGNLDWPAIIAACRKIGVKHYIVEQDSDWLKNDPFKALAFSYNYLNKTFGMC